MIQQRERPIIFSGPMVRAILDGRKSQTRRVIKDRGWHVANELDDDGWPVVEDDEMPGTWVKIACPYGRPGDRLWVRETFGIWHRGDTTPGGHSYDPVVEYRADGEDPLIPDAPLWEPFKWHPSIHMPKWAARVWLEITGIRAERLLDISEEDAVAEGVYYDTSVDPSGPCKWRVPGTSIGVDSASGAFLQLWDFINAKRAPADASPWVWVIEFDGALP